MTFHMTGIPSFCSLCGRAATSWLVGDGRYGSGDWILGRCVMHERARMVRDSGFSRADSLKEIEILLVQRS